MSAPLYVIAPLPFSPADARHVEALRRAHDPQVDIVPAHFTLVFGARGAGIEAARAHVATVAQRTAPIAWRLDRVVAADDFLFLMPSEGERALRALHGQLYNGPFAGDLRSDIPFEPHVTVGVLPTPQEARRLAEMLSRRPINIAGRLERLELVAFADGHIEPIETYVLSAPAPPD